MEYLGNSGIDALPRRLGDRHPWARLRGGAVHQYIGLMKLHHLFRVDITGCELEAGQLYDLSWIIANRDEDRDPGIEDYYYEPQDAKTRRFIETAPASRRSCGMLTKSPTS